jgi:hypothetical protein
MCGIIGIFKHDGEVNVELYEGLLMLQHRCAGQAEQGRQNRQNLQRRHNRADSHSAHHMPLWWPYVPAQLQEPTHTAQLLCGYWHAPVGHQHSDDKVQQTTPSAAWPPSTHCCP